MRWFEVNMSKVEGEKEGVLKNPKSCILRLLSLSYSRTTCLLPEACLEQGKSKPLQWRGHRTMPETDLMFIQNPPYSPYLLPRI